MINKNKHFYSNKKNKHGNKIGFTLVEVILAVVILSGSLLVFMTTWRSSRALFQRSMLNEEVAMLLEKKVSDIQMEFGDNPTQIPEEASDQFEEPYKQYKWSIQTRPFDISIIKSLASSQEGGVDDIMLSVIDQFVDVSKQAVREVKITVSTQIGKKELSYSLSTLFVDFKLLSGGASNLPNSESVGNAPDAQTPNPNPASGASGGGGTLR